MAQTIQIKRSTGSDAPTSLANGELAYLHSSTGSKKLYIGNPGGGSGDISVIGGKDFTDKLDGIEANADVTDATNVAAAGALMTSGGTLTGALSGTSATFTGQLTCSTLDLGETSILNVNVIALDKIIGDSDNNTDIRIPGPSNNNKIEFRCNAGLEATFGTDGLSLKNGTSVNEFSTDNTLGGDSDDAVPTEKAVKGYVDTEIGNLNTGVTGVTGTAPIASSGGASPSISINLDNTTVEKNTSTNKLQAKTGTVVDNGTALATGDQIHAFVTGQGYVTTSGVTSVGASAPVTVTNGSSASPTVGVSTAAVTNGSSNLATGDQIHDFVTGLLGDFTFSGGEISSTQSTITIDPSVNGPSGTVVIDGSLQVKGTTTTVDSTTVQIGDNILLLNKDYSGSNPSADAGLEVERGTQTNALIVWDESASRWSVDPGTGTLSPLNVENVAINGGTF